MPDNSKERIIKTTAVLLQRQGYAATGLNQIVKLSRAPKGSLYYYFPGGKEELVAAAMDYLADVFLAQAERIASQKDGPEEIYRSLIDMFIGQLQQSGFTEGGWIATVTHDLATQLPLVKQAALRLYNNEMNFAMQQITRAGYSNRQAKSLAVVLLSSLEGAIMLSKVYRDTQPLVLLKSWCGEFFERK